MNEVASWIDLQGTRVPLARLHEVDIRNLTANEKKAVEFCTAWLDGKDVFEITTSGSTGVPQNIKVKRQAMIASARGTAKALGLRSGMTSLVCLDTGFIAGMMMLVRSMTTGMNMIVREPSANPLKDLPSSGIDFTALVPYQMAFILKSEQRERLSHVGMIILGGAFVSTELVHDLRDLSASCYATFGMTETLSHVALQRLNGPARQENFQTLDGVTISIDDRGCLMIGADYLGDIIITNDLVEIINPKEFKWLGRYDNVINSGGIKVIPEQIEQAIGASMLSKGISRRFFVTGFAHPHLGQEVGLVVEGTLSTEDEHSLLSLLRIALGKYEVPRRVVYKDHFTETKTGKIDRRASLV
ncbi:MAG TPA: AMP-binding protein [Cyclobacteriaceae bacterium]|nr:AMP-binding protein [Cyclobacteriaceae bacterium]